MEKRRHDPKLQPVIQEMVDTIAKLIDLAKYVEQGGDVGYSARLELWKLSLKMGTDDPRIKKSMEVATNAGEKDLVGKFALVSADYSQRLVRKILHSLQRARDFKVLHFKLKEEIKMVFDKAGLPDYLAIVFIEDNADVFIDFVTEYLADEENAWTMLTSLLAPGVSLNPSQRGRGRVSM